MSTYTKNTLNIQNLQGKSVQASFYKPARSEMKTALLYFHGGGFVFGSRNDLPAEYIELFTSASIGLVAVDYPLAPETKFPTVLEVTHDITEWFVDGFLSEHQLEDYFILGRSAGAFLALKNGAYAKELSKTPAGIISLYGYFNLNDASFTVPNRHYLQYPKVSDKIVSRQIQNEPLLEASDQNRYLVYMASRQKGDWVDLFLSSPEQKRELSMTKEEIQELPPLFISASKQDPDIPARQSRQLANFHDEATLHLVDVAEHDFDRTHLDLLGKELYEEIITWMFDILS